MSRQHRLVPRIHGHADFAAAGFHKKVHAPNPSMRELRLKAKARKDGMSMMSAMKKAMKDYMNRRNESAVPNPHHARADQKQGFFSRAAGAVKNLFRRQKV